LISIKADRVEKADRRSLPQRKTLLFACHASRRLSPAPKIAPRRGGLMALQHAQPLEIIEVRPLGAGLRAAVTTSLLKTPTLQLMRLVLRAGDGLPEHSVRGATTVHCLEGEAVVTTAARRCELQSGQLVMLVENERHAVQAVTDSSLLVTVLLHTT
jgi:quercetin dioxygenase-like cupin family protein